MFAASLPHECMPDTTANDTACVLRTVAAAGSLPAVTPTKGSQHTSARRNFVRYGGTSFNVMQSALQLDQLLTWTEGLIWSRGIH